MNIWQFQEHVSKRLLAWSGFSIVGGLFLLPVDKFWRGFGGQAITWGVIDAAIALGGQRMAQRRQTTLPDALHPGRLEKESNNLRRLLLINAGLDVFYILGGLAWSRRAKDDFGRGNGWGVVVQGAFLLVFDVIHALRTPRTS
jgi:hypothetical protein